ncbi:MAG: hypothetical protein D0528_08500 [Methylococcales bacterium]|nr:MAG: hypothetical protein D0528_08500 [Methylococcales bacterium]
MNNNAMGKPASSEIFTSDYLINNIGTPFAIGLAVGYFAKKMLLITLFLFGAAIVLLFVSEHYGITEIYDVNLQHAADSATHTVKESGDFLINRLSKITCEGVSATGGFLIGFKMG